MGAKLTVLVPAFNEERNLPECLASAAFADEVYVVDSFSTDATPEIARGCGVRLEGHEYVNSATQKNWAIPRCSHEWVFLLDADERITPALRDAILAVVRAEPPVALDGYEVRRTSFFLGRKIRHCGWGDERVLRLFRRDRARYEDRQVHAKVLTEGPSGRLVRGELLHYTTASLAQYFEKFNRYTAWSAGDLRAAGKRVRVRHLLLRPAWRFFKMYVLKGGFLDGVAGIVLCGLAAMSVFTRYARLWEMTEVDPTIADLRVTSAWREGGPRSPGG